VIDHHPDHCASCGASLSGASEGAEPWRHQIVDIPPVTPIVVEHLLHQLICPCCQSATRAVLPSGVESSGGLAFFSDPGQRGNLDIHLRFLSTVMAGIVATRSIRLSIEQHLLASLDAQGGNRSAAVNEAIELWLSLRRIKALEEAYSHLASLKDGDLGAAGDDAVGMGMGGVTLGGGAREQ
jgi:hypothetical protein